jgi:branched-chain amino acid transport system ATP-binding protein
LLSFFTDIIVCRPFGKIKTIIAGLVRLCQVAPLDKTRENSYNKNLPNVRQKIHQNELLMAFSENNGLILRVEDIHLAFGQLEVLNGVSFDLHPGEILGVIGPNGAGKTALLNCINGFYHPYQGHIYFQSRDITNLRPDKLAAIGIGRTFQGLETYENMTVLDTILSGRHIHMKANPFQAILYWPWVHKEELEHRAAVENVIKFLEIQATRKKVIGDLSYGLRKRVDLARALSLDPKVLLLDEPLGGMNLEEKEDLARFILDINEAQKTSIALVEHDMGVVMDIADRIIVMDWGNIIATGTPAEIRGNTEVIKAYLGEE